MENWKTSSQILFSTSTTYNHGAEKYLPMWVPRISMSFNRTHHELFLPAGPDRGDPALGLLVGGTLPFPFGFGGRLAGPLHHRRLHLLLAQTPGGPDAVAPRPPLQRQVEGGVVFCEKGWQLRGWIAVLATRPLIIDLWRSLNCCGKQMQRLPQLLSNKGGAAAAFDTAKNNNNDVFA